MFQVFPALRQAFPETHVRWGYLNQDITGIMEQALQGIGRNDVTNFQNILKTKNFDSSNMFTNDFVNQILNYK